MKYLKSFENHGAKFKVISYDDNFEDNSATDFTVTIDTDFGQKQIFINYEVFLNFIQEIDKNLKSYIENSEDLTDFQSIFGDLEELGLNYRDFLQKWVDANTDGIYQIITDEDQWEEDDNDNTFFDEDED
jgi:hypothetical protein